MSIENPIFLFKGHCGYCNGDESKALYMELEMAVSTVFYQDLIEEGWRRSGAQLFYLPLNDVTCCPLKPLRVKVAVFSPSLSQRRTYRRIATRYCLSGPDCGGNMMHDLCMQTSTSSNAKSSVDVQINKNMESSQNFTVQIFELRALLVNFEISLLFALFLRYQQAVHGDAALWTIHSFKSFAIDTVLKNDSTRFLLFTIGSQLVGMSIVDILPDYLSSYYFFYEPAYKKLSLGTFSILMEIQLAYFLGCSYYTLGTLFIHIVGFYSPKCPKLLYKGAYGPAEIGDQQSGCNKLFWKPLL